MANKRIADLPALGGAPDPADLLVVEDVSVPATKSMTMANLIAAVPFSVTHDTSLIGAGTLASPLAVDGTTIATRAWVTSQGYLTAVIVGAGLTGAGTGASPLAVDTTSIATRAWVLLQSYAIAGRLVNTTAPMQGGGDLTADRTLSLAFDATLTTNLGQLSVVYGATASTACQGNDARLSDARQPAISSAVAGDLAWYDGTSWKRLAGGVARAVLTSAGSSAQPTWTVPMVQTTVQTGAYTVGTSDQVVPVNSTSAAFNVTLPKANAVPNGWAVYVKDKVGACATNNVTIVRNPSTSDTIDGGTTYKLATNYAGAWLVSDGVSAWSILVAKV
jgi:hypothetical protein